MNNSVKNKASEKMQFNLLRLLDDEGYKQAKSNIVKDLPMDIFKLQILLNLLNSFEQDLNLITRTGKDGRPLTKIVYAIDYTEFLAYENPEPSLKASLFGMEEIPENNTEAYRNKVIRRWYRAKRLFFETERPSIVLPSHLTEVEDEVLYFRHLADRNEAKLFDALMQSIQQSDIGEDEVIDFKRLSDKVVRRKERLEKEERKKLLRLLEKIPSELISVNLRDLQQYRTRKARLYRIVNEGKICDLQTYDWVSFTGISRDTEEKIKNINIGLYRKDIEKITDLFKKVREDRSSADLGDAEAVVYLHRVNEILSEFNPNVQMHLVTYSPATYNVTHSLDKEGMRVPVRHPKLLAELVPKPSHSAENDDGSIGWISDNCGQIRELLKPRLEKIISNLRAQRGEERSSGQSLVDSSGSKISEIQSAVGVIWPEMNKILFARDVSWDEEGVKEFDKDNHRLGNWKNALDIFRKTDSFDLLAEDLLGSETTNLVDEFYVKLIPNTDEPIEIEVLASDALNQVRIIRPKRSKLRYAIFIHNPFLIKTINRATANKLSDKITIEGLLSDIRSYGSEFNINILTSILAATNGHWRIVLAMCCDAISKANVDDAVEEAFFLRNLANRAIAFEVKESKFTARRYMRYSMDDLKRAQDKEPNDLRFKLAGVASNLALLCFPDLRPAGLKMLAKDRKTISDVIQETLDICDSVYDVVSAGRGRYSQYIQLRCLQMRLTIYFSLWSGLIKDAEKQYCEDDFPLSEERIFEWYDSLCQISKNFEIQDLPTFQVVKNAIYLIREHGALSKLEQEEIFDTITDSCRQLSVTGFARELAFKIKSRLSDEVINQSR